MQGAVMTDERASRIILARDLREALGAADRLEMAVKRGELVRVGWGLYAHPDDWATEPPERRAALLAAAVRRLTVGEPVFSHESAAALHRIPLIGGWSPRVWITVPEGGSSSSNRVRRVRRALPPGHVMALPDGTRVTTPIRTAIDIAGMRSPLAGIVAMSAIGGAAPTPRSSRVRSTSAVGRPAPAARGSRWPVRRRAPRARSRRS